MNDNYAGNIKTSNDINIKTSAAVNQYEYTFDLYKLIKSELKEPSNFNPNDVVINYYDNKITGTYDGVTHIILTNEKEREENSNNEFAESVMAVLRNRLQKLQTEEAESKGITITIETYEQIRDIIKHWQKIEQRKIEFTLKVAEYEAELNQIEEDLSKLIKYNKESTFHRTLKVKTAEGTEVEEQLLIDYLASQNIHIKRKNKGINL